MKVRDEAYNYYFYFIQERMNIFWKRFNGCTNSFTEDPILSKHKFTNVYRAQDRVSQYLIKNVIGFKSNDFDEIDTLLRIIVFKIFNNIRTWEFLQKELGEISAKTFDVNRISILLSDRIRYTPIFSAAYMMTGSHVKYKIYKSKHEKWLTMVDRELLTERRFERIIKSKSLEEVFKILQECSFIGDFLAYQYATDFNYSDVINFDENSFVKAGIGSIRGIKKCFLEIGNHTYEDCIKYTYDNLSKYQDKYGFNNFKNLFGREPHLIDLQNCFCETDKYLRVKLPSLKVDNTRIKQKFNRPKENIFFSFPEKWGINKFISQCISKNSMELTLF